MARPQKNTVDYFPHLIGSGKKMQYIEMKYGNDGYATWFKILETLASTQDHFLNLNEDVDLMFLSAKTRVSVDLLLAIIEDLVLLKVINKKAWEKRVIWSGLFMESIKDAYKRREAKTLDFASLCKHLLSIGIHINYDNSVDVGINAGKEKKGKEKEIKEERDAPFENSILNFFDFSENANFNHARTLNSFIHVITEQGRLEYFKKEFEAYRTFKTKEGLKYRHAFKNFIGDQKQGFEDGLWDSENWTEKLKSIGEPAQEVSKPSASGFVIGQKPRGAVSHA